MKQLSNPHWLFLHVQPCSQLNCVYICSAGNVCGLWNVFCFSTCVWVVTSDCRSGFTLKLSGVCCRSLNLWLLQCVKIWRRERAGKGGEVARGLVELTQFDCSHLVLMSSCPAKCQLSGLHLNHTREFLLICFCSRTLNGNWTFLHSTFSFFLPFPVNKLLKLLNWMVCLRNKWQQFLCARTQTHLARI